MIFQGETREERRRKDSVLVEKWRRQFSTEREELRPRWEAECKWHPYFAWFIVDVGDDKTAWLTWVERRIRYPELGMPDIKATWYLRDFIYRLPQQNA